MAHLTLLHTEYWRLKKYPFSENGKFQFLQDIMYQYAYNLTINSTFDKEAATYSELKFEFKVEIRIEDCEGVLRVSIFLLNTAKNLIRLSQWRIVLRRSRRTIYCSSFVGTGANSDFGRSKSKRLAPPTMLLFFRSC